LFPGKKNQQAEKLLFSGSVGTKWNVQSTIRYANTLNYFVKYNIFSFLRLPLILSFSVPIFWKNAEKSSLYERGRVEGRQSFAIPDLIQDPEIRPNIHKIIMHTPGLRVYVTLHPE
tara:strand:- start:91 stop:438 length:348 start_codon:yes stop_codon:yes gene_type:complete